MSIRKLNGFFAYVLLCVVILCGCQKERYTYTEKKCVDGYYEEYWTGGRMINKPTMDANRLEKRWVCTEYITDTLIGYRWVDESTVNNSIESAGDDVKDAIDDLNKTLF